MKYELFKQCPEISLNNNLLFFYFDGGKND
jgi:hypothetical protein